jgi:hypothetical protein
MITDDKIKEIKKLLKSGTPEGEIKNDLIAQGYTSEEIKRIFAPGKYDMRSWYLTFGIIFLLAGIYFAFKNGNLLFFIFSAAMFYQYYLVDKKCNNS